MKKVYSGKGSLCVQWAAIAVFTAAIGADIKAQDITWVPITQVDAAAPTSVFAERPRIASDGSGNVIAVYGAKDSGSGTPAASDLGVQVLRSTSNGTSWDGPAQQLSQAATGVRPDIATDGLGNWLVAWGLNPAGAINTARSTNHAGTWAGTGSISSAFGAQLSSNRNVALATDRSGVWMAAWLADDTANSTATVAVARSTDNGNSWQAVTKLSAPEMGAAPAIAGHQTDGFIVVYEKEAVLGEQDASDIAFAVVSSNGTIAGSGFVNDDHTTDTKDDFAPTVSVSPSGNWAVTWARQSIINAADWEVAGVTSSDGVNWTSPMPISFPPATDFKSAALADPSSAYGENGRIVTLWTTTENTPDVPRDIFYNFQRTPALEINQSRLDLDFEILNTPYFNRPDVAQVAGGRWLALWQRLEVLPAGKNLSGSSPWFSHGLETGLSAGDTATTTDLSITKTAWPDPSFTNGDLGYVITVRNLGTTDSANLVTVTDNLPAGVTFRHAVASRGTWSQGVVNGQPTVVAQLGSIAPGERASVAIAVRPTISSGSISNTATVDFLGTDIDPSNNSATVVSSVGGSGPINPGDPGNPGNPGDPGDPGNPGDPTDPGNPGNPGNTDLLQITPLDVKIKGKEPKPGKPAKPYKVTLKAMAANVTMAPTPVTNLSLYISDDAVLDPSDVAVGGKSLKSVKPGKAQKLKLNATVNGNPTGRHLLLEVPGQQSVAIPLF